MHWEALVLPVLLLTAGLIVLYGVQGNAQEVHRHGRSAIGWMVGRWNGSGGDLSHGWLVPLVSAYVLFHRRSRLQAAVKQPAIAGFVVVALAMLLHWAGVRSQLTRLSLLSMILFLWGTPYAIYGRQVSSLLIFPCAYLLFCIPFSFLNSLTVPLRLIAATCSTGILNGLAIEATQVGTAIYSGAGGGVNIDVADACSGLRSLIAMSAVTAAYAQLTQRGWWRQWILFLSAVPVAMVGNMVRIVTVAMVASAFGKDVATKVYHDLSGFIVFAVALSLMMLVGRLLTRTERRS